MRLQILPILQAEQDLEHVKRVEENKRLEAIATADDPNWKVGESVYHVKGVPQTIFIQ